MYTEDNLIKIKQRITKLQMGERVIPVAYGDRIAVRGSRLKRSLELMPPD